MALTALENQRLYDFEHARLEVGDRREMLKDIRSELHDELATLKLFQALELLTRADKLLDEGADIATVAGISRSPSRPMVAFGIEVGSNPSHL